MEIHDSLKVKVLEAKKLVSINGLPPTSFVEVVVGDSKRSTRDVLDTNNPKYGENPLIFERVLGVGVQALLAYIFHRDTTGGKNICIGVAVVPLETFYQSPKVAIDYWYEVQPPPSSEEEQEEIVKSARKGESKKSDDASYKLDGIEDTRLRLQIEYDNHVDEGVQMPIDDEVVPPNLIQVTIVKCEGLISAGETFVEAQIGSLKRVSKSVRKSNSPQFDEQLDLPVSDGSDYLEITVKQFAIIRSKVIGRTRIPLNEIAAAGEKGYIRTNIPLLGEFYDFSEVSRGDISLMAKWIYDTATETKQKEAAARSASTVFATLTKFFGKKKKGTKAGEDEEEKPAFALTQAKKQEELLRKLGLSADMTAIELTMYLEKQREDRLKEIEAFFDEEKYKEELEMPESDYTIQVHVIEVADLVGLNASGLSDPVVVVEVMSQTQSTRVIYNVNSAFFDQTFYFNFTDLKRDQLQEIHIKFSVYDFNWNPFNPRELIGVFEVDLPSVYASRDHELYRRWANLRDPTNEEDTGSQGLLKYSIVALAAGDSQRVHDPITEEDDEEEKDLEVKEGAGIPDLNRNFAQTLNFLVISLFRAEGLPGYDRFMSTIKQGLYIYAKVEFAGCQPMKTTKVAIAGKKNLSVTFDEEIWLPVWVPSYSKRASITLMNREFGRKDQVIATTYIDFDTVPKYDRDPIVDDSLFQLGSLGLANKKYDGAPLQIIHFYGAHTSVRDGSKAARFMNKFPRFASAYRGSMMASFRVIKFPSPEAATGLGGMFTSFGTKMFGNRQIEAAHKKPITYDIPENKMPQTALYALKIMVYQGSDFGSKGQSQGDKKGDKGTTAADSSSGTLAMLSTQKYMLQISIGSHEVRTQFRAYRGGAVDWIELHDVKDIDLPRDLKYIPDTFVTVYRGNEAYNQSVAFTRLKSIELLPTSVDASEKTARWYELQHDLSHRSASSVQDCYPGSVLMKICLTSIEDEVANADWETYRRRLEITKPYHLRVYVYQCRHLPTVRENGLLDPYVKLRFGGEKAKTATLSSTRNPTYYQVFTFDKMLPEDLELAPHLVLQLWDGNLGNSDASMDMGTADSSAGGLPSLSLRNMPVAALRKELKDLPIIRNVYDTSVPKPVWMDLTGLDGQGNMGQILVAFQLFEKKDVKQALPIPPSIRPTFRRAYLDIHTIGLRNLLVTTQPKTLAGSQLFGGAKVGKAGTKAAEADDDDDDDNDGDNAEGGGQKSSTKNTNSKNNHATVRSSVKRPAVKYELFDEGTSRSQIACGPVAAQAQAPGNANYLARHILPVSLPDDAMFAPTLEIFIYDERTFSRQLVAVAEVDLASKLIWNPEEFVPPRQHQYLTETLRARQRLAELLQKKGAGKDGRRVKKGKDGTEATLFAGQDEDDVQDQNFLPKDDGTGVFPTSALVLNEQGLVDHNLPTIVDREEIARLQQLLGQAKGGNVHAAKAVSAAIAAGGDDLLSSMGLGNLDETALAALRKPAYSINEQIKRMLKIPTAWTSASYMKGRDEWVNSKLAGEGGELEDWLQFRPFENYDLYQGRIGFTKVGKRRDTMRKVGTLKAVIRVVLNNPRNDDEYTAFKQAIRRVEPCKVRLYVLRAQNLQPIEGGNWLINRMPDPYLQVSLDKQVYKAWEVRTGQPSTNPDFYFFREFDAKLPGPGILKLSVLDKSLINGEQCLGETEIDLEDRWFHPKWAGTELKPIENRNLYKPTSRSAQGTIMLWVDIFTVQDALKYPPIPDFARPESRNFEIRIVCWRSKDVKYKGQRSLDLYTTFFMDGAYEHRQSTDTHWLCRTGKGSWNYRVKIPITLPIKSRERGRLRIQLWNRNIIRSNEVIGEVSVHLFNWLLLVYKRKTSPVFPFKEKKEAEAKIQRGESIADDEEIVSDEGPGEFLGVEMDDLDLEDSDPANTVPEMSEEDPLQTPSSSRGQYEGIEGGGDGGDDDTEPLLSRKMDSPTKKADKKAAREQAKALKKAEKEAKLKEKEKLEEEEAEKADRTSFIDNLKQYFGMDDTIPDDASWLKMTYLDKRLNKSIIRGQLAISVAIVPESEAKSRPVGTGREEPNNNPYLPPPVGRFGLNFSFFGILGLLGQLIDPCVLCWIFCICICVCVCSVFMFLSIYLSGIESTISLFKSF